MIQNISHKLAILHQISPLSRASTITTIITTIHSPSTHPTSKSKLHNLRNEAMTLMRHRPAWPADFPPALDIQAATSNSNDDNNNTTARPYPPHSPPLNHHHSQVRACNYTRILQAIHGENVVFSITTARCCIYNEDSREITKKRLKGFIWTGRLLYSCFLF